jgi:hypothetical protein
MGFNMNKKVLGLAALAAMAVIVTGCGGSGGGTVVTPGSVTLKGGAATTSGTSTSTVDATSGSVVVTTPSGSVIGELPAGLTLPVGSGYAVVPAATPLFTSITLASKAPGDVFTSVDGGVTYTLAKAKATNRAVGSLTQGLQFDTPLLIPSGKNVRIKIEGPFTAGQVGSQLSISGSLELGIAAIPSSISTDTTTTLPASVDGALPANGNSTLGKSISITAATQLFNGKSFTLKIVHNNGTLQKTSTISGGVATFSDLADQNGNSNIPSTGVQSVQLIFNNN